jgi:hypothetical protein
VSAESDDREIHFNGDGAGPGSSLEVVWARARFAAGEKTALGGG